MMMVVIQPLPPSVRVAFASLFAEPFLSEQDPLAVPLLVRFLLLVGREERREVRPRDELQSRQGFVLRVEVLCGRRDAMGVRKEESDLIRRCGRKRVLPVAPLPHPGNCRVRRERGLTISPSKTTFSPRMRNTPRSVWAYDRDGGWNSRSIVCVKTRLATRITARRGVNHLFCSVL
jgi:hypothetical protein